MSDTIIPRVPLASRKVLSRTMFACIVLTIVGIQQITQFLSFSKDYFAMISTTTTYGSETARSTAIATATAPARGRVFACGYVYLIYEFMFPDFEYMGETNWKDDNNANDILLIGKFGPDWDGSELTDFSGKIIYLNGESYGNSVTETWEMKHRDQRTEVTDQVYQIGAYPTNTVTYDNVNVNVNDLDDVYNSHSLQVHYMVVDYLHWELLLPSVQSKLNAGVDVAAAIKDDRWWNLLVEGNGYRNDNDNDNVAKPERIHAVVYTQRHTVRYRQEAAVRLAETFRSKTTPSFVHYNGDCHVANGIPVPTNITEKFMAKKSRLGGGDRMTNFETEYSLYKYCLVMENSMVKGYISEKIYMALLSGCLPIYYGDREIFNIFRDDAFVYYDIDNPEPALAEIRYLEENPAEYQRRTSQELPLLRQTLNTNTNKMDTSETVDRYFSILPGIGTGRINRKMHQMMGLPLPRSLASAS